MSFNNKINIDNLVKWINRPVTRNPPPRDLDELPKWSRDISKDNPTCYLVRMTTYMTFLGLSNRKLVSTLNSTMFGASQCV